MRADVRQGDSSRSVDWCDDPSQEVSALPQDVLCNAQAADILRGNLVVSFLESWRGPFADLAFFFPGIPLGSLPSYLISPRDTRGASCKHHNSCPNTL